MKIALVSCDNSYINKIGGKHIHQNLLEKGLKRLDNEVHYFYPDVRRIKKQALKTLLNHPDIFSFNLNIFKSKLKFNYLLDFFEKINFKGFDIVHAHDVISLLGSKYEKIILTVHGYFAKEHINYNYYTEKEEKAIYDYAFNIEKKAIPKAKYIIAVDTRIKDYIIKEFHYPENRIEVLYNAIDTDVFKPVDEEEKNNIRTELNIPMNAFVVLVPRRFVDKNGVIYAAKAFSKIEDTNFYFIFAGRGPLKNEIEEILKNKRNSMVLDNVNHNQIIKYYQASDVILIPSITTKEGVQEATSLSMLEGMSCEKIVVGTKVGGLKEIIKDGVNGLLIEEKSDKEIIKVLDYIHKNKLDNIRKNARQYVIEHHSYIEYAKRIIRIYERVLGE